MSQEQDRTDGTSKVKVTILASEWGSSKGGLSTINRELAIQLAKCPEVEITFFLPQCSEEDKKAAVKHSIKIVEATRLAGYEKLEWVIYPPEDLQIDIVVGHGVILGRQAQVVKKIKKCKWVQVVHTDPEELGMFKDYSEPISKGEEKHKTEVELCEMADQVVAVGPKLSEAFRSYLCGCQKHENVLDFTPGVFEEFVSVKQVPDEGKICRVLVFGRGDAEDFALKGFDIAGKAVAALSYTHLVFVGAPYGKQEEIKNRLTGCGVPASRLRVRSYVQNRESLKRLFQEADLVLMPSRTEGFGLTGLEALSAGLPVLVSQNSGFGETLSNLQFGSSYIIDSEDSKDWAAAIKKIWDKDRKMRLQEAELLRDSYQKKYNWTKQIKDLLNKMISMVHAHSSDGQSSKQTKSGMLPSAGQDSQRIEDMTEHHTDKSIFSDLQKMQSDADKVYNKTNLSVDLRKIASDKGFTISDNRASGNCMFYALSEQLQSVRGIQIPHRELRRTLVQFLTDNANLRDGTPLFNFVCGYPSWPKYLESMAKDGTWGDNLVLLAAANCFQTHIRIISSLGRDFVISSDGPVAHTNPLVLGNVHEEHYVSLQPRQVPLEIRDRGIEAELAYRDALLEGKVKVCRARLLIIGQDRAGKTSLKRSLIGLPFNPHEPSTEVLEVSPSKFEFTVDQVVEWKAVNDDEDDQARPQDRSVARLVAEHMLKKKADEKAMSEEKPATDTTQLNGAPQPLAEKYPTSRPTQDSDIVSEDLVDNITMPKELAPLVAECLRNPDIQSDENSTTQTVLDIWDFAGQHLYYATHPIFFSHKAVYLLVHNFSKTLHDLAEPSFKHGEHTVPLKNTSQETNLDMLLSWLVSVHSIRQPAVDQSFLNTCKSALRFLPPPVLLVGTHADKVSSHKIAEVEDQISSNLKGKAFQEHVLVPFYKVDNTKSSNSPDVKAIQARVQRILSSGFSSTDDLPLKWFNFEKAVKNLASEKFYSTLDDIRDVARQAFFIEDDEQLDAMLNYYHDMGVIVRFKDTILLDTQWLINIFKKLITIRPYQEQEPVDRKLWEEFENTGVLHMQLIDRVFENNLRGNRNKSVQQSILDMMEMYGFLARYHLHKESDAKPSNFCGSECKYFVPAQPVASSGDLWSLPLHKDDPCPLVFTFCTGFVPHGLFSQLVSRLIARFPELECVKIPQLYCNGARFFLGKRSEFEAILLCSKRGIRLVLTCYKNASTDTQQATENSVAVKVRSLIEEELESLFTQWHWLSNVRYHMCVVCSACKHSRVKCERHKSASCSNQDCSHLLPISKPVEPNTLMTCHEQIGDHSRFIVPNLHKWYSTHEALDSSAAPDTTQCHPGKSGDNHGVEKPTKRKCPLTDDEEKPTKRKYPLTDDDDDDDGDVEKPPRNKRAHVEDREEDNRIRQTMSDAQHPQVGQIFYDLQQMQHDADKAINTTNLPVDLKKIASNKGFMISDNQGSGNCMFYALSEQLDLVKQIQISHDELRQSTVQYLKDNPTLPDGTELFNFVHGYPSWDAYLRNMMKDDTWGDHVILHAAANKFKTYIHVISSLLHHHDLIISPVCDVISSNQLMLGHVHEHHYVSLIRRR